MECAVCGQPGVGYWCSEEHLQSWCADQVDAPARRLPRMPGAAILWGADDDRAA